MILVMLTIAWLLGLYLVPAIVLSGLTYFLTSWIKLIWLRKTLLIAGLTIAWAPGVFRDGHVGFFGHFLFGIVFVSRHDFKTMLVENSILILITFVIVTVWIGYLNLSKT